MNKYYILHVDPQATHERDRCVLRSPITGARPDLNAEVAGVIDGQAGCYLIKVNLQIEILEQSSISNNKTINLPEENRSHIVMQPKFGTAC